MNILLLSRNIGIIKNKLPEGSTIGFIPTAGEIYDDPWFVIDDNKKLNKMNYRIIDIDITNENSSMIRKKLKGIDALFVAGGNVFYLMQQLEKKSVKEDIIKFISSDKLYIGSSAGSCICSPSLEPYQTLDDPKKANSLTNYEGLGILDYIVLPHYGKDKYTHIYQEIIDKYQDSYQLVTIKDDEAIVITSPETYTLLPSCDIEI